MPTRRLGRPPLPPETTRSQRVVTFVTQAELEQLHSLADRKNLAISAVVHQIISKELEK
ncbi:MAG: hypothetical protein ABJK25_08510 [Halieaceae bacterium]